MLTEGWNCNTVTHVVGLSPFQPQLLCVFTAKRVREAVRSHVNLVIIDSIWEAQAAELLDSHPAVGAYVKNDGLNFTIPLVRAC
jgi:hypothetical protein